MEKAVVTEALGFTGYHLCSRLLEEGVEVTGIDHLGSSRDKENKLDYFGRNALFHFHDGEIKDLSMRKIFEETDACFCVGPCLLQKEEDLLGAIHDVFENVRTFADAASEKFPSFVVVSSTDVYGRVSGKIMETEVVSPTSLQGLFALVSESLFDFHQLSSSVLRLPEIYGPGQPSGGSLYQILHDKSPDEAPIDFIYIEDAVDALIAAAEKRATGVFNIASGRSGLWKQACKYLIGENLSPDKDEKDETRFCIDKAKDAFGFQPATSLEEGIEEQKR